MCIALNADVLAGTAVAAADTGAVSTAAGSDITTGDGNVGSMVITLSIVICAAADTGTTTVAACQQLAGSVRLGTGLWLAIIVHIVLDGQGAGAVYVCFFNTGVV